jgi:hypothetical protein
MFASVERTGSGVGFGSDSDGETEVLVVDLPFASLRQACTIFLCGDASMADPASVSADSAQQKVVKSLWQELGIRQARIVGAQPCSMVKKKKGRAFVRRGHGRPERCIVLYSIPDDRCDMVLLS